MSKYVVELIGTFFLVFTIGMTVVEPGAGTLAPVAIGAVLMVMIYAGGHISGGHYNPAVTLAVWLRGRCPASDVPGYMAAQLLAAILAALVVDFLKIERPTAPLQPNIVAILIVELLFTFALAYVVLNVATARRTSGNSYFGLAIGFTVLAGAFAVGPISGAAFNPAVAIGVAVMGLLSWATIWAYLVAGLVGGALAAVAFRWLNPDDR